MLKMKNKLPVFQSEKEENEFWMKSDSVDYIDWDKSQRVMLPKLKPSTKQISLRLPEIMIEE